MSGADFLLCFIAGAIVLVVLIAIVAYFGPTGGDD